MDTLFLCNTKTLKEKFNTKVFAGDNHITKINVQLPDNLGGYPKKDCEFNLRAIIPEGNLSYMIEPSQPYFYITNDITEKAQTVKLMMVITHEGNVIGRTNTVDLIVNEPAEAPNPPLTPREEFDEVIAEQRVEIAEQAETISEQASQIEAKDEQISELNGQVTELEAENAEQAATITRQNTTIDELNRRVPPLQQLDPINPSDIQQTLTPESPNIGFPQVIVNPVSAEGVGFNPDYYKEDEECLGKVGTYNPFPYQSQGGVYVLSVDEDSSMEDVLIEGVDYKKNENQDFLITDYLLPYYAQSTLKSLVFKNCQNMGCMNNFNAYGIIKKVTIQGFFKLKDYCLQNCNSLKEIRLESPLQYLGYNIANLCANLETIYLANTITSTANDKFQPGGMNASKLKNVILENGFQLNGLKLQQSTLYSVETIVSCLEALADLTGQAAKTITFGTANLNKLTAEQKAIAINKNWNLN